MGSTFVLVSKDDKNMLNMQRNSWRMTGTIQYPMDNGPPLEILKKPAFHGRNARAFPGTSSQSSISPYVPHPLAGVMAQNKPSTPGNEGLRPTSMLPIDRKQGRLTVDPRLLGHVVDPVPFHIVSDQERGQWVVQAAPGNHGGGLGICVAVFAQVPAGVISPDITGEVTRAFGPRAFSFRRVQTLTDRFFVIALRINADTFG